MNKYNIQLMHLLSLRWRRFVLTWNKTNFNALWERNPTSLASRSEYQCHQSIRVYIKLDTRLDGFNLRLNSHHPLFNLLILDSKWLEELCLILSSPILNFLLTCHEIIISTNLQKKNLCLHSADWLLKYPVECYISLDHPPHYPNCLITTRQKEIIAVGHLPPALPWPLPLLKLKYFHNEWPKCPSYYFNCLHVQFAHDTSHYPCASCAVQAYLVIPWNLVR